MNKHIIQTIIKFEQFCAIHQFISIVLEMVISILIDNSALFQRGTNFQIKFLSKEFNYHALWTCRLKERKLKKIVSNNISLFVTVLEIFQFVTSTSISLILYGVKGFR